MRQRLPRHSAQRRRATSATRGFTLLEVVLALGLASLLLAAVYAALQMHWTYSTTGQVEMERAQLVRALFRRMDIDIRSVINASSPTSSGSSSASGTSTTGTTQSSNGTESSSTGGTSTASSSSTTSSLTGSGDTGATTSTQKTGLFGEAQTLVVHASLPSRMSGPLNNKSASTGTSSTSVAVSIPLGDQQSVAYFLRGSSSTLAQQISSGMAAASGQVATGGLCRMQGDRAAMQVADEAGDLSSLASQTKLIAPEIADLQFEFFDGVSWSSSWDSGVSGTLPNAIRITLTFLPPDTSKRGWFARPVNVSSDTFSYTVALPLAEPYVGESL